MQQKYFYTAFQKLFDAVKDVIGIYQKEEFYRLLFHTVYEMAGDNLYDNDPIRKVTSGGQSIHFRAIKKLYTYEGFEAFRRDVEQCFCAKPNANTVVELLLELCRNAEGIPVEVTQQIEASLSEYTDYRISRAIASILLCLNQADYNKQKQKDIFPNISFMRLAASEILQKYPRYITDGYSGAVKDAIGSEEEIKEVYDELLHTEKNILVTGVGGLGKTVFIQQFLTQLEGVPTSVCEIEKIAWIPYDNHDIRLSMKQAFRFQCDLNDVWQTVQNKCAEYRERMLLVVDNIESVENDEYLWKLSKLPCRILATSRQKSIPGFYEYPLKALSMEQCRNLFYQHYQFPNRDNEVLNDIIALTAKLTIMIVFLGKVAYTEGLSLRELYWKLVERGFKLSEEDVSCEHEKLYNDATIIQQMCILFSLVN